MSGTATCAERKDKVAVRAKSRQRLRPGMCTKPAKTVCDMEQHITEHVTSAATARCLRIRVTLCGFAEGHS